MLPETATSAPVSRRPDEDVHADVLDALWSDPEIRALDRDSLVVEVRDGLVHLTGHMASTLNCDAAEDLASSVDGVVAVQNDLVADTDLAVAISQALADDSQTRRLILSVAAFHGWVSVTGDAPSEDLRTAVQRVVVSVPGVRGVFALPAVAGRAPGPARRALQPAIGAAVFATDGWAGRVVCVVVDPSTRLVTGVGAAARFEIDSRTVNSTLFIPEETVHRVSETGVFLIDNFKGLASRAPLDDVNFPLPPASWRPPFPYAPQSVRWQAASLTA